MILKAILVILMFLAIGTGYVLLIEWLATLSANRFKKQYKKKYGREWSWP